MLVIVPSAATPSSVRALPQHPSQGHISLTPSLRAFARSQSYDTIVSVAASLKVKTLALPAVFPSPPTSAPSAEPGFETLFDKYASQKGLGERLFEQRGRGRESREGDVAVAYLREGNVEGASVACSGLSGTALVADHPASLPFRPFLQQRRRRTSSGRLGRSSGTAHCSHPTEARFPACPCQSKGASCRPPLPQC